MIENIPKDFINFALVLVFSLLIGMEQRRRHFDEKPGALFGTDRTHVFIGILGFMLFVMAPQHLFLFAAGGIAITIFLSIFYWKKIENRNQYGITSMIIVLITYSLAPLVYLKPIWMAVSLVTVVLVFTEIKQFLWKLSSRFDENEFITLAKFLLISGVILPLLPHHEISAQIPVSPFKIWMAVVVISGISYISYLIQKFIFPDKGIMITGILGGIYSSTATTVVLARRSKTSDANMKQIAAAIIVATAMMFLRILALAYIFNTALATELTVPFVSLAAFSILVSFLILKVGKKQKEMDFKQAVAKNPLEFKTALLFALLFVVFTLLTKFVMLHYGNKGLDILSFIVGVTDVDPFLLSLFTGKYHLTLAILSHATLIAVTSNNLIKLIYGLSFGSVHLRKLLIIGFSAILAAGVLFIIF
ncbi:DUF4010 domain-containing protein [Candidatus Sulfidibacterium hydrothermale]|uniref:MgtC/SapB family protein n=1 Tax=Candidatus Sulfidibacterium hydrothermale TaxID=2875962 RepID=UPI001F0AD624|nr:DUF4010 domain-containing protein [Candidatus Sulfidibacterium hydrothermale]UBM62131.1 DUF4010 domain-containing protein [Candidatus Sulfidibacterium hydrothermale]